VRVFPSHFQLTALRGPRAIQFASRENAFQQLVGDALKEMTGSFVHVSPTKGQDGSIDCFVDNGGNLTGPFEGLGVPIVIECKDHDDAVRDLRKNILRQWTRLSDKLQARSLTGWKGLFQPWTRARGYVYCISAVLQSQQIRDDLTATIQRFFASLPATQRPPIDFVRVVDWNDLRQWLETLPHVTDAWLGVELELVLDHSTYLDRLTGSREFLRPSKLEFVPPPENSPFHPARILDQLEAPSGRDGVLLVGVGGVGKTRTAIEVSSLAVRRNWRVLHVLPGDPGVGADNLAQFVLPYPNSKTLLVFDYLDQMHRLDLASIRRSLLPQTAERGIQLRLLGNSRPAWLTLENLEREKMFLVIRIQPTESQRATLTETMVDTIAPKACREIGRSEVIRLCGTRAILGLFIARELERQAKADLLRSINVGSLRSGDLLQWLRQRLQENFLTIRPEINSLLPARPEAPMVAAGTVLACSPDTEQNLVSAAESAYQYLEREMANEDAQYLVQSLVSFGWLEINNTEISAAHDVVADEVLDQIIHKGSVVFKREFEAVLSSALKIPNAIDRLSLSLGRVIGMLQEDSGAQQIGQFQQRWFQENAPALGKILRAEEPALTDDAIAASPVFPSWDDSEIQELEAVHWFQKDHIPREAGSVLPSVLERADLTSADSENAIRSALRWLEEYVDVVDAQFMLKPLLERWDLSHQDSGQAIRFALRWLQQYHLGFEATFVLKPLLERSDLSNDDSKQVQFFAVSWLESHYTALEATFVIAPLLERTDLSDEEAKATTRFALLWLEQHDSSLEAQFVLKSLLERSDLSDEEAKATTRFALLWLEQHYGSLEAQFVLKSLLERFDLSDEDAKATTRFALLWLEQYQRLPGAAFVFPQLLGQRAIRGEDAYIVIKNAVDWLQDFYETPNAEFVLRRLFRYGDLPDEIKPHLTMLAIQRLRFRLADEEAAFLLRYCLQSRIQDTDLQNELVSLATEWLDLHPDTASGDYVWNRVLRYPFVPDLEWKRVAKHALHWLEARTLQDNRVDQTINSLLTRPHLLEKVQRDYLLDLAVKLLPLDLHPQGRRRLLDNLDRLRKSHPDNSDETED